MRARPSSSRADADYVDRAPALSSDVGDQALGVGRRRIDEDQLARAALLLRLGSRLRRRRIAIEQAVLGDRRDQRRGEQRGSQVGGVKQARLERLDREALALAAAAHAQGVPRDLNCGAL